MQALDRFTARLHANNLRPDGREPLQYRLVTARYLPLNGTYQLKQASQYIRKAILLYQSKYALKSQLLKLRDQLKDILILEQTAKTVKEMHNKIVSKLLQTVVIGSKALDPQSLSILSGKYAWRIKVEGTVITDDGNVIDSLVNGVFLALIDTRKPLVKLDQSQMEVQNDRQQPLSLAHIPISMSFALVEGNILVDPTAAEQRVISSRMTITMNIYKQLCSVHKPGGLGISQSVLSGCVKLVEQKVIQKTAWIRNTAKQRPTYTNSL